MTKPLKYITPFFLYILALVSFTGNGFVCWLTMIFAWIIIPLAELFLRTDPSNMEAAEEELARKNKTYDHIVYSVVVLQYSALFLFLWQMTNSDYNSADAIARVGTMGLLCGTFGINAGHELGHRVNPFEQWLAKSLLLTSLYTHFIVEHNKGHHKNVATKEDPSSARLWEPVYTFYFRTIIFSYINAWKIANNETKRKERRLMSIYNEMLQLTFLEALFVLAIFAAFGSTTLLYYLAAAGIGILLLETVNYIEHYGLSRKMIAEGKYERAQPVHSWNSDHVIGRLMLFELSRHSDHHYLASRKYQVLRHHNEAPQMPTGYPGMMILSLFPPAWFYIMHRQMKKYTLLQDQRININN